MQIIDQLCLGLRQPIDVRAGIFPGPFPFLDIDQVFGQGQPAVRLGEIVRDDTLPVDPAEGIEQHGPDRISGAQRHALCRLEALGRDGLRELEIRDGAQLRIGELLHHLLVRLVDREVEL